MPGETYQTLKSKATKQAKQSGMSQDAAENYGSAMASQAAQVGGAVVPTSSGGGTFEPEFFGGWNAGDISSDVLEALSGSTAAPLEQIAARKEAEKKMQEAGGVYNTQTGEVEYPPKKEGIFNFSGFKMPPLPTPLGIGVEFLKGLGAKDKFFEKLVAGESLTPEDKVILANLIAANKKNPNVFGDLSKYATEDVDVAELGKRLQNEVRPLENRNYQSLIDQYLDRKPEGLDSFKAMYGDLTGTRDLPEGTMTLEKLKSDLGKQGLAYLKANDPKSYYSFIQPQTTGGLQDLGALDATKYAGDADFQNMIYAAREAASRRNPQVQEGGEEIPSLAVSPTPFTNNLEVAQATTTPVTAATTLGIPSLTPTTLNYASMAPQFGSQYPGYINQGVMNPNLSPYYDNLRKYYGVG
jgi:hypothetical protein